MRAALAVVLAIALTTFVLAHVVIVLTLAVRKELGRAALALFVPPLAPLYAAERSMRIAAYAWLASLVVYGVVLAFA